MGNRVLSSLGWSKRTCIKVGLLVLVIFIIGPVVAYLLGSNTNNALLWLTGLVVLVYTIETQEMRLELVRQTEVSIQPLIITRIERREVSPGKFDNVVILQNIGRGPALFIQAKEIDYDLVGSVRWVGKFDKVDYIEAGKDTVAKATLETREGEEVNQQQDFVNNLDPNYSNRTFDVTISYEDINGQKRESVVRMGQGGIRLLTHGSV